MTREILEAIRNDLLTELKKEKAGEKETELPMVMYRSGYVDGVLDYFNHIVNEENKGELHGVLKEEKA